MWVSTLWSQWYHWRINTKTNIVQWELVWSDRWWDWWHDIHIHWRCFRFRLCNSRDGGDGINVRCGPYIFLRSFHATNRLFRAPTSGGQYHWVSEFAPKTSQRFLSYITGWVCVLGWHTGIASCCYTVSNMLIGIIAINYPDSYEQQGWHGTLLVIAVAFVAIIFNTFLAQKLPLIEGIILILHCFGFFAILVPLWVLAPRRSASEVFSTIQDNGGWGNNGLSCLVGLVGPIYSLIGKSVFLNSGIS